MSLRNANHPNSGNLLSNDPEDQGCEKDLYCKEQYLCGGSLAKIMHCKLEAKK
jgi:hypothetical protein